MSDDWAWRAIHEAGHALIARTFGLNVSEATLSEVRYSSSQTPKSLRDPNLLRELVIATAGGEAVALNDGGVWRGDFWDLMKAQERLMNLRAPPLLVLEYITEARKTAREILLNQQAALRRIASALQDKGRLTCHDIDRAINDTGDRKHYARSETVECDDTTALTVIGAEQSR